MSSQHAPLTADLLRKALSIQPAEPVLNALGYDRDVVPTRRGGTGSVPLVSLATGFKMADALFEKFGLEEYVGCATAEMARRPIPSVFPRAAVADLAGLFKRYYPMVADYILARLKAKHQAYNLMSRLGFPHFVAGEKKLALLKTKLMPEWLAGKTTADMDSRAFIIYGVRLQAESKKKTREFQFVSPQGEPFSAMVDAKAREVDTVAGKRVASRTRNVFNMPELNLRDQVFDTAYHAVQLEFPLCHHNVFGNFDFGVSSRYVFALDVKHFERHTSGCARFRAEYLGGEYERSKKFLFSRPFLCPSTGKPQFFISASSDEYAFQYASGDSMVAPLQKDIIISLLTAFAVEHLGMTPEAALQWALAGGDSRCAIVNYGDDNVFAGSDSGLIKALVAFLSKYLTVEEEFPARFLGMVKQTVKNRSGRNWVLPTSSYLTKTYLNERRPGSQFRPLPCYGWVQKRAIYTLMGSDVVADKVFPMEDSLLSKHGHSWEDVQRRAAVEALRADRFGPDEETAQLAVIEKDWMLTAEQKLTLLDDEGRPQFIGFEPAESARIIKSLVPHTMPLL